MDDMTSFELQLEAELALMSGPGRRIDAIAVARAAATRSPRWRVESLFRAARFAVAGVIVVLFGGFLVTGVLTQGPRQEPRSGVGATAPSPSPKPASASDVGYLSGRRSLTVDGVPLSFSLPADSSLRWPWESLKDDLYIANSTEEGQSAEAIILWTSFPDSLYARPCLLSPSAGSSAADLADALAMAPGIELVSGPSDVTVAGRAAKHVVLSVVPDAMSMEVSDGAFRRDVGCNPAYFFAWEASDAGAFWLDTEPGDSIKVWIVDVDGKLLFIEAETKPDAGKAVEQEIEEIIDSIRFE